MSEPERPTPLERMDAAIWQMTVAHKELRAILDSELWHRDDDEPPPYAAAQPPSGEPCRGKPEDRYLCAVHEGGYFRGLYQGGTRCTLALAAQPPSGDAEEHCCGDPEHMSPEYLAVINAERTAQPPSGDAPDLREALDIVNVMIDRQTLTGAVRLRELLAASAPPSPDDDQDGEPACDTPGCLGIRAHRAPHRFAEGS